MNFSLGIGIVVVHPHTLGFGRKNDRRHYSRTKWLWDRCVKLDVPRIVLLDPDYDISSVSQIPVPKKENAEWVAAVKRITNGFDTFFKFKEKLKREANLVLHTYSNVETLPPGEWSRYDPFLDKLHDRGIRNLLFVGGYFDYCLSHSSLFVTQRPQRKSFHPIIVWDICASYPNFNAMKVEVEQLNRLNWFGPTNVRFREIRSNGLADFARRSFPAPI